MPTERESDRDRDREREKERERSGPSHVFSTATHSAQRHTGYGGVESIRTGPYSELRRDFPAEFKRFPLPYLQEPQWPCGIAYRRAWVLSTSGLFIESPCSPLCGDGPLEAIKVRVSNVVLLNLYQTRAIAGGYPAEKESSRATFVNERGLQYALF